MSTNTRSRQKKIERQKKKRELAKHQARASAPVFPTSWRGIIRLACEAPLGPAWATDLTGDEDDVSIATVVITRALPRAQFLAHTLLVDRTCLGVKAATLLAPMSARALLEHVGEVRRVASLLKPCDLIEAQSIVFHALDYAKALGFEPHRDFVPALVEPRPAQLIETQSAHRARPLYVRGPYDDVRSIVARLCAAVGPDNFDFVDPDELEDDEDDCEDCDEGDCEDCDEGDCEDCDEGDCEDCDGCDRDCDECAHPIEDGDDGRQIVDAGPVEVRVVDDESPGVNVASRATRGSR